MDNRTEVKYPEITVRLGGLAGSSYAIIVKAQRALGVAGVEQSEIERFTSEVMAVDSYNERLQIIARWVNIE